MKSGLAKLLRRLANLGQPTTPAIDETRFTILDIETTGLNFETDEILAIGAIRMHGSHILVGETFYTLVQPRQHAWPGSVPIHRILPADVKQALPLETVWPDLAAFVGESVLVGHTVRLDRTFLTQSEPSFEETLQNHLWLDTSRVARWLARRNPGNAPPQTGSLSALAQHYQISILMRHHALADAFATAQIWQRQLVELKARGIDHLGELARIGRI